MKNFVDETILVTSSNQIKELVSDYSRNQKITFYCEVCNEQVFKRLATFYKGQTKLLCKACKTKQGIIEKYGSLENFHRVQQELREAACLKKYGVKNISSTEAMKDKKRKIFAKKEVKDKIRASLKKTCLERYGVDCFRKSKECQESIKKTSLQRYGVDNISKSPLFMQKATETWLKKYGVTHPSKLRNSEHGLFFHSYSFDSIGFDSSWELAFYIFCKDHKKDIEREPVSLEYEFQNKIHTYFPDFRVDGILYEIKGNQFLKNDGTWQSPYNRVENDLIEAKRQCALKNNVKILYYKDCKPFLDYVKKVYGRNYLKQFKN